jgi:hypothetical protein
VARTAGVDRSFLHRHNDLRFQILVAADQPKPRHPLRVAPAPAVDHYRLTSPPCVPTTNDSATRPPNSPRDCPRCSANKCSMMPDSTRTDEISSLRELVAELEQQLLDRRQGPARSRDDERAAARATNRDLTATLNRRPQPRFDDTSSDAAPAAP